MVRVNPLAKLNAFNKLIEAENILSNRSSAMQHVDNLRH